MYNVLVYIIKKPNTIHNALPTIQAFGATFDHCARGWGSTCTGKEREGGGGGFMQGERGGGREYRQGEIGGGRGGDRLLQVLANAPGRGMYMYL